MVATLAATTIHSEWEVAVDGATPKRDASRLHL